MDIWEGPMYGDFGELHQEGEKIQCHICGRLYTCVGMHIPKAHDMAVEQYKATFDLSATAPLTSATVQARLREGRAANLTKAHAVVKEKYGGKFPNVTPEQAAAVAKQYADHPRLQTIKKHGGATKFTPERSQRALKTRYYGDWQAQREIDTKE